MRVEQVQVVRAPREQVFQTWTDYEAWPTFADVFAAVKVTERTGNTVLLNMKTKFMGRTMGRTERISLKPPEQIQVVGETEVATSTTHWTFESVPEGTLVTAVMDVELIGLAKVLRVFAKRRGQTGLRDWLRGFAKYVEARYPNFRP